MLKVDKITKTLALLSTTGLPTVLPGQVSNVASLLTLKARDIGRQNGDYQTNEGRSK